MNRAAPHHLGGTGQRGWAERAGRVGVRAGTGAAGDGRRPAGDGAGRAQASGARGTGHGARTGNTQASERGERTGWNPAGWEERNPIPGGFCGGAGLIGRLSKARKSPTLFRMGRGELGRTKGPSFPA